MLCCSSQLCKNKQKLMKFDYNEKKKKRKLRNRYGLMETNGIKIFMLGLKPIICIPHCTHCNLFLLTV